MGCGYRCEALQPQNIPQIAKTQIIDCIDPRFFIGQDRRIRVIRFVTKAVEHLQESPHGSIQFILKKLVENRVLNGSEGSGPPLTSAQRVFWHALGG